jgi:MoaA/NifB/PqqE/SkfB family radical SAM enzyme
MNRIMPEFNQRAGADTSEATGDKTRQIAFGYSTKCNIKCEHCVAADESPRNAKMELSLAREIIEEMAYENVTVISFTAGEPLLFFDDMINLVQLCKEKGLYSRIVTNGFWAGTQGHSDTIVSELMQSGLSQLRISSSRWHQKNISRENIVNAAHSCQEYGLDYFISFVTDFSEHDDPFEQFLRDSKLKYFPEPLIYFGRAGGFNRSNIFTDYQPNTCSMNPYLSPELDMYACCDAGIRFTKTGFFYLGNLKDHPIDALFRKKEQNPLFSLIRNMGLSTIASYSGFKASEIVTYRKCELCEELFNSPENLRILEKSAKSDLANWTR